ncbi:MAG: hypothetical protein KAT49_05120 [Methanomicrobia archaeon]|nr:hypothetical protein [Methanomicrobia archaeon]
MGIDIVIKVVGILGLIAVGLILLSGLVTTAEPPVNYLAFAFLIIAIFWAIFEAFGWPGKGR